MEYRRRNSRSYLKYMRQSVAITGLGSEIFQKNLEVIKTIQAIFSREFQENALVDWTSTIFQKTESIDIANRYFVPRQDASPSSSVELHPSIDPTGRLRSLASRDFVHTEDNEVQYYESCASSGK
jgi:hypothetical protein